MGFRYNARTEAQRHGLAGWVRNCADGAVEAQAQGKPDGVARFVEWARQGPTGARVDRVQVERCAPDSSASGFQIRS